MSRATIYPPEHRTFKDQVTGAAIHQLTDHLCHSSHFYFTHLPYYAGGTKMLFHSDRGNARNIFEIDLRSFEIRQVTGFEPGEPETLWEEDCWIGHINTSPHDPSLLTFCHEGPWSQVDNRIWGLDADAKRAWKIRAADDASFVGHEI